MAPSEEILWADRPEAKHAWTAISTSHITSRRGRVVVVGILMTLSVALASIGLFLLLGAIAALSDSPSKIGGTIGVVLLAPFGAGILAVGALGIVSPWLTIHYARSKTYVLTSHSVYSLWDMGTEIKVDRFDLAGIHPPSVERVLETGIGDVVLDQNVFELVGGDSDNSYAFLDRGLFAVPDAEAVGRKIEETRIRRLENVEAEIIAEMQEDYQGYLRRTGGQI